MTYSDLGIFSDIHLDTVRHIITGKDKTIGFTNADKLMTKMGKNHLWVVPPLLEHYDRILKLPPERKCNGCGKIGGFGNGVCPPCAEIRRKERKAAERRPCRRCEGPKQDGDTTFCSSCAPLARAEALVAKKNWHKTHKKKSA